MKICGTILSIIYACIMILAVFRGRKRDIASVFIMGGSILVLTYGLLNVFINRYPAALLATGIAGMAAISIGALINGIRQNHVHVSHHIIRLVMESAIIALCAFG